MTHVSMDDIYINGAAFSRTQSGCCQHEGPRLHALDAQRAATVSGTST